MNFLQLDNPRCPDAGIVDPPGGRSGDCEDLSVSARHHHHVDACAPLPVSIVLLLFDGNLKLDVCSVDAPFKDESEVI